jgi:hypothetical protein
MSSTSSPKVSILKQKIERILEYKLSVDVSTEELMGLWEVPVMKSIILSRKSKKNKVSLREQRNNIESC